MKRRWPAIAIEVVDKGVAGEEANQMVDRDRIALRLPAEGAGPAGGGLAAMDAAQRR